MVPVAAMMAAALLAARPAPLDGGTAEAGAAGARPRGNGTERAGAADGGPADGSDAGAGDPDADLIEHLDELELRELLEHLELFDPEGG
jgi:hypothetical protein